jgi:outer membrane biosynthesis protein TonB
MSLIDEALKRARQEAAKQDAVAREERYKQVPVIPGLRSRPSRSPMPLVISGVIAACLAVGIAIGVGLSRDDSRDGENLEETRVAQAAPETRVAEVQPEPAPVPAPAIPTAPVLEEVEEAPEPTAPPVQEAPAAPAPPDPAEEAAQRAAQREIQLPPAQPEPRIEIQPSRPPVEEPSIGPALPAPVVPAQPAPAAPADESGTVRTFQREMPVQGGTLRLNGIAFSDQPVALFDDKVLAPGESIAGYKVVAIEPKRVRLEGPGGVVFVELP